MDGMPHFDDEVYNHLVHQWEAVSHTLDLMREHDITLSQNEQWHSVENPLVEHENEHKRYARPQYARSSLLTGSFPA
jgi:hypothetical protein